MGYGIGAIKLVAKAGLWTAVRSRDPASAARLSKEDIVK